ncbi:HNH endonuclease signature motif containing protein [Methylomonas fluvii]|uniref:HNH endonuclease n=1 Tax=Methylomonas fluvii TaxID=1854564 RepID=A0ABR9DBD8_9GAMM|nr:HNH endonuclease signature motif containing protein [Methylomonas fluvii]MBD9360425.1 HNH endonuclease [Methylomonas fluvii]
MAKKKKRIEIPPEVAAQVLFSSDRTCCVCRTKGKPVQIHHIDDNPSHNVEQNLSVLCFDCHRETQIRGGFDRKLDANQVILYRNDWIRTIAASRATSEVNRELDQDGDALDIELITSIAEIYRENEQFELLAVHYNAIGNVELRDKYVELALNDAPSDDSIFYLRATIQGRPDLIPQSVVDRHLATYVDRENAEQHARALFAIERRLDAAVEYIRGVNQSLQEGNWFSAAYYLREFNEGQLVDELLIAAYRKASDEGSLWWQVRALQELGWESELKELILSKKEDITSSKDVLLLELLAESEGDIDKARAFRKEMARNLMSWQAEEEDKDA